MVIIIYSYIIYSSVSLIQNASFILFYAVILIIKTLLNDTFLWQLVLVELNTFEIPFIILKGYNNKNICSCFREKLFPGLILLISRISLQIALNGKICEPYHINTC